MINGSEPSRTAPAGIKALNVYTSVIFFAWAVFVALTGWSQFSHIQRNTLDFARQDARIAFSKDLIYRQWATLHGGVYAPVTEQTPPNPYLKTPERDIVTPSGKHLTLINPAYMTRQVHEMENKLYGTRAHITSLNPIRPQNAPDEWERAALKSFTRKTDEYDSLAVIDNIEYLRFMRPLVTEQACLKCHAEQGYQLGDIRGGISIAVPMTPHRLLARSQIVHMAVSFILLWSAGMVIIFLSYQHLRHHIWRLEIASFTAEQSNASKSRLLAVISHDIRAPLVSIAGLTAILQEEDITPAEQKEYVAALNAATGNIMNLVDDILDISRLEAGKLIIEIEKWPLREITTEICSIFKTLAEQKKLRFHFQQADDVPPIIRTDARRLKQCLSNLIYNAIKFTHSGQVALSIDTVTLDNRKWLRFKVEDTGPGISIEKQACIFEAFMQADNNNRKPGGTGLGLAITKQLIERLDGKITLISLPGKGSAFTLFLPID